ncbi:MAG: hypothetical protein AMXMBFR59_12840 [Rhodanobacteraceae bacterium]
MSLVAPALLRAELPYRDPAWVYSLLERRAATAGHVPDPIGIEAESVLLARSDPLINLALARFSLDGDVVAKLFMRGGDLRTAALTNRVWYISRLMRTLPGRFFGNDERLLAEWLGNAPEIDVLALFENPTLDDQVAASVVLGTAPFDVVPEEQRIRAVWGLSRNPALVEPSHSSMLADIGWATQDALWKLADVVPPTHSWGMALAEAYEHLKPAEEVLDDPRRVAARWITDPASCAAASFARVRACLARLVGS